MRHRPAERALRNALPTLAAERHEVYNAYQSQHGERVENALSRATHLASFIGHEAGRAMFVGMYEVADHRRISNAEFWRIPENRELEALGARGAAHGRRSLWFDLRETFHLATMKGCLVVGWPGIERSWWRWAGRNVFPVQTIHEESRLVRPMPDWREIVLAWKDMKTLPASWRSALSQWRGIYYIFDATTGKGYVGSASGADNLLGRWKGYAASGHAGNRLLRNCDPDGFAFSILQRVSPDMEPSEVVAIENSWKQRLHSRAPDGLNDN